MKQIILFTLILVLLTACAQQSAPATPAYVSASTALPENTVTSSSVELPAATAEPSVTAEPAATFTPAPTATLAPNAWMSMPVIPETVSERTRAIYQRGQELGNSPNFFIVVGDCGASPGRFMGDFAMDSRYYTLGDEYAYLQDVIDYFSGSFGVKNLTQRDGFSAGSVLAPLWADPAVCEPNETPLACELRIRRPAFAFVIMGTNDYTRRDSFDPNMRKILDYLIEQGVIPILGTKADNMEGDQAFNTMIAQLAYDYEVPLWNFWLAAQPLPGHGLLEDGEHLTWAGNHFNDPTRMQAAWPWRNLTALQTLDFVWRSVSDQPAQQSGVQP